MSLFRGENLDQEGHKPGKKLKLMWFCYFTNNEIQNTLNPYRKIGDIAPWISQLIPIFEGNENLELHIVSQHEWISGYRSLKKRGVNYHFFNKGMPFIGRHWPVFFRFDIWTNFFFTKRHFARIVNKIKPDIIHLHGAENDFCTAITQFHNKYPVFITIQGFIKNSTISNSRINKVKIRNEMNIIKMFNHFGYRTNTMGKDIKSMNPGAILHWHDYPINVIKPRIVKKVFDLVFFARVTRDKGIEDLIRAVSIIKNKKPDISLVVIGGGKTDQFKKQSEDLGIKNNVHWAGFLPTQDEVHNLASKARISVLPTYHDIISGTIIESLFLMLPVVAYNVGSIHEVNKHEEIISLVEKFNIKCLAASIFGLLKNKKLREEKAEKGYIRALEMFSTKNDKIQNDILKAYKAVIDDYDKNCKPI